MSEDESPIMLIPMHSLLLSCTVFIVMCMLVVATGIKAKQCIDGARKSVSKMIHVPPQGILYYYW